MKKICYLIVFCLTVSKTFSQNTTGLGFDGGAAGWKFTHAKTTPDLEAAYTFKVGGIEGHPAVGQIHSPADAPWAQLSIKVPFTSADTVSLHELRVGIKTDTINEGSTGIAIRLFSHGNPIGYFEKAASAKNWDTLAMPFLCYPGVDSIAIFGWMKGGGTSFFENFTLSSLKQKADISTEAKIYLDTVMALVTRNALYKDSVDLQELFTYTSLLATGAKTSADCYTAIRFMLSGLGDKHSRFYPPSESNALKGVTKMQQQMPTARQVGKVAYLHIPTFQGLDSASEQQYARELQNKIKQVDKASPTGWVIDLRDNEGGNVFPMLLGLGPVLGDGTFQKAFKGNIASDSLGYHQGNISYNGTVVYKITKPYRVKNKNPRVAILIGPKTASSGESVVLAFKGRPQTRMFGEPTKGLTTYNAEFWLSDGAILFLCAGKQSDRFGNQYGNKISPDQLVINDESSNTNDNGLKAAIEWLGE